MIDFVDTSPFLRKALWVAMATMRFYIVQTGLFMGNSTHYRGPREQFGTNSKLSLVKLDPGVDGWRPSVYL